MHSYFISRLATRMLLLSVFALAFPATSSANTGDGVDNLPLSVLCQPVKGNEVFFGGKPTFNTFYGRPVPLSFRLRGTNKQLENTSLVLYLPASFKLLDIFQSNKVHKYKTYDIKRTKVTRDGQDYYRYKTTNNLIEPNGVSPYKSRWRACQITVALDAPKYVKSGKVYWAVEYKGKEYRQTHFTVNFLKPLPLPSSSEQGQFRMMPWVEQTQLAYSSIPLQKDAADLLLSSGIREVSTFSRYYNTLKADGNGKRVKFEDYLQSRGINLVRHTHAFGGRGPLQVSSWSGWKVPRLQVSDIGIPGAMDADGKRSKSIASPIPALNNGKFRNAYFGHVRAQLKTQPKSKYVTFDYEPWAWHNDIGYGPKTLTVFKKRYSISGSLTPAIILNKYKEQWTKFWLDISHGLTKMMAKAVHAVSPETKIISYTYFRDYEVAPNRQWKQFEACAKDPRREAKIVDELMFSAYHTHGKKLFDAIRMSKRHIHDANISVIAGLARQIPFQSWVRSKKDALSPQRLYQMAILCAALGVKRFGIFPGQYIDGAFYVALGKASRLIWAHEKFYYGGANVHKQVSVSAVVSSKSAGNSAYAYTAQQLNGRRLVTLFNFTDKNMKFTVSAKQGAMSYLTVKPHGVGVVKVSK